MGEWLANVNWVEFDLTPFVFLTDTFTGKFLFLRSNHMFIDFPYVKCIYRSSEAEQPSAEWVAVFSYEDYDKKCGEWGVTISYDPKNN